MESVCPTCESVIDPTRAPVARIVGARVVTFCSTACADGRPAAPEPQAAAPPKPKPKPKPAAPAAKAAAEPEPAAPAPVLPAAEPEPAVEPEPLPGDRIAGKNKRRSRGVILGASAVLLVGVAVVALEAWPRADAGAAETLASAADEAPAAAAAVTAAVAEPAEGEQPAVDGDAPIDPKRLYDKAYAELRKLLGSQSPRVQRIAAMALARAGDEQALERLRTLLDQEESELVVVSIAYALARAGDDQGRKVLVSSLRKRHRDVKLDAARSLVRLGDDAGAGQLRGMLSYKHYRIGAAGLLARLGDERGFEVLRETRADKRSSQELKMRATVALGLAGDDEVKAELVAILDDGRYQVGAAHALAALRDENAIPSLTRQLDIDAFRVQAALGLRRMGADVDLAPLASALHTGNEVVRVTAGEAILVLTGDEELAERD